MISEASKSRSPFFGVRGCSSENSWSIRHKKGSFLDIARGGSQTEWSRNFVEGCTACKETIRICKILYKHKIKIRGKRSFQVITTGFAIGTICLFLWTIQSNTHHAGFKLPA